MPDARGASLGEEIVRNTPEMVSEVKVGRKETPVKFLMLCAGRFCIQIASFPLQPQDYPTGNGYTPKETKA